MGYKFIKIEEIMWLKLQGKTRIKLYQKKIKHDVTLRSCLRIKKWAGRGERDRERERVEKFNIFRISALKWLDFPCPIVSV